MTPDAVASMRRTFDNLFKKGLREKYEMVDDMFEGMERRGELVEEAKGKARAASQDF